MWKSAALTFIKNRAVTTALAAAIAAAAGYFLAPEVSDHCVECIQGILTMICRGP